MTAARTTWPEGHVIHMSLDHTGTTSVSVAACDCGWEHRVPWQQGTYQLQDEACESHWRDVESQESRKESQGKEQPFLPGL